MNMSLAANWLFSQLACRVHDNAKQKHPPREFVAVFMTANVHRDRVNRVRTIAHRISQAETNLIQTP